MVDERCRSRNSSLREKNLNDAFEKFREIGHDI